MWSECATRSAARLTRVALFTPAAHLRVPPPFFFDGAFKCQSGVCVFSEGAEESWRPSKLPINSTFTPPKKKKKQPSRQEATHPAPSLFKSSPIAQHSRPFLSFPSCVTAPPEAPVVFLPATEVWKLPSCLRPTRSHVTGLRERAPPSAW